MTGAHSVADKYHRMAYIFARDIYTRNAYQ